MNRYSQFALRAALLVSGAWSTVILAGLVVTAVLFCAAVALNRPPAPGLEFIFDYGLGVVSVVVALLTAVVGVPILARRHRVGFWCGLLAVAAALCWLVPPFLFLVARLGAELGFSIAAGLDFVIAVVLAVILYRRRREPPSVADVFS